MLPGISTRMRYPAEKVAEKRRQILDKASALFRQHGFTRVSVSDVMKASGLTHGAFYSHFKSKDELIDCSLEHASARNGEGLPAQESSAQTLIDYVQRYLSQAHREDLATGCLMAALGSELGRQQAGKAAFTSHVNAVLHSMEGALEARTRFAARRTSIKTLATMVGALTLARAVGDRDLSNEILDEMRSAMAASETGPEDLLS